MFLFNRNNNNKRNINLMAYTIDVSKILYGGIIKWELIKEVEGKK